MFPARDSRYREKHARGPQGLPLRSLNVVQDGLMELRSGLYKGVHGVLPVSQRPKFEEGVNLLFSSWTALCLAIDNTWGGPTSRQKAEQLYQDVLCWFYGHTGMCYTVLVPCRRQHPYVFSSTASSDDIIVVPCCLWHLI